MALPPGSFLRLMLTGVTLLFLPGYALTFAVFPGSRERQDDAETPLTRRFRESTLSSVDPFERLALAVGFSVCLMPVYGYLVGLNVGTLAYDARTVVVLASAATVVGTVLASIRFAVSPSDIVVPAPFARLTKATLAHSTAVTPRGRVLNVAVIVALVLVTANLTVAIALPTEGSRYTTAVLLSENETGDLVTGNYPEELPDGDSATLVFRVENHEAENVRYNVVVQQQRVNSAGRITETSQLSRFNQSLAPSQAWEQEHRVTSTMSGERVRLVYLIYKGDAPDEPTLNNSYRNLTLWVGSEQVAAGGATGTNQTTTNQTTTNQTTTNQTTPNASLVSDSADAVVGAAGSALPSAASSSEFTSAITNTGTMEIRCI